MSDVVIAALIGAAASIIVNLINGNTYSPEEYPAGRREEN